MTKYMFRCQKCGEEYNASYGYTMYMICEILIAAEEKRKASIDLPSDCEVDELEVEKKGYRCPKCDKINQAYGKLYLD